jgi:hypothetical protein
MTDHRSLSQGRRDDAAGHRLTTGASGDLPAALQMSPTAQLSTHPVP